MKIIKTRDLIKQIICIIIVLMLCNFIIPSATYAASDEDSGTVFAPFCKFITFLCDSIMQFLQNTFTSNESIAVGDGTYNFQYTPAIIFSGTVPAFDINFIKPNTKEDYGIEDWIKNQRKDFISQSTEYEWEEYVKLGPPKGIDCKQIEENLLEAHVGKIADIYTKYYIQDNYLHVYFFGELYEDGSTEPVRFYYFETNYELTDEFLYKTNTVVYGSTALKLQGTIATWYKALRRIALVGLLSVLVYIGIQIVLTTASGKENSKYKKMLTDWLIALCLMFTMHYIMNFTLVATEKISSLFNNGETDHLLNTLRTEIEQSKTLEEVVSQIIMYVVMTIYTVTFSFQYLKRVLYMGFFTMIAPLVTLTYPLDKIKDSKAQAFTMWIREYVFNALIQVVHLVVYYTLIGGALSLVENYPIYAIVTIGFMTQGEKIIRKMFGFNNATTVGTLEAAATGGLITAALNKLQKVSKPNNKKDDSKEKANNSNVRTVANSITNSLRETEPKHNENTKSGPNIKGGAKSLLGRYGLPGVKAIGRGVIRTTTTATGTVLGLAGGLAKGDISEALKGAAAGGAIGDGLAKGGINFASNLPGNVKKIGNDIQDTYNEGAYGAEYAQDIKRVREFKQTKEYKELKNEFRDQLTDEKLSELLKAAIKEQENKG